eukprot:COSAG05_NODE_633_length_8198_cov_7.449191_4_plen_542_part_00
MSINGQPLLEKDSPVANDPVYHSMTTKVLKVRVLLKPALNFISGCACPLCDLRGDGCSQVIYSCVIVANAAMGAGMLSFPFGFKVAGWALGIILVVVFAIIQTFSLSVIARASRNYTAPSYEHLIGEMFGEGARKFLISAISVFLFLVCVAYLTVISAQATHILNEHYPPPTNVSPTLFYRLIAPHEGGGGSIYIMLVTPVILYPLTTVANIAVLGPFSSLAVCAVLYTSVVIAVHGFQHAIPSTGPTAALATKAFSFNLAAFQAIPIICFGMFCHFTIVPSTHALKPYWPSENSPGKTRMRTVGTVCAIVMMICVVVYSPVGALGYFTFGKHTESDILDNYGLTVKGCKPWCVGDDFSVQMAFIAVAFTMCMSFPIFTYLGRTALCGIFGLPIPAPARTRFIMAACWCTAAALTAVLVTVADIELGFIVSILGCTACTLVQFHFPARMCTKLGWKRGALLLHTLFFLILVVGMFVTIAAKVCKPPADSGVTPAGSGSTSGTDGSDLVGAAAVLAEQVAATVTAGETPFYKSGFCVAVLGK